MVTDILSRNVRADLRQSTQKEIRRILTAGLKKPFDAHLIEDHALALFEKPIKTPANIFYFGKHEADEINLYFIGKKSWEMAALAVTILKRNNYLVPELIKDDKGVYISPKKLPVPFVR